LAPEAQETSKRIARTRLIFLTIPRISPPDLKKLPRKQKFGESREKIEKYIP
jgi:hypothetical protein